MDFPSIRGWVPSVIDGDFICSQAHRAVENSLSYGVSVVWEVNGISYPIPPCLLYVNSAHRQICTPVSGVKLSARQSVIFASYQPVFGRSTSPGAKENHNPHGMEISHFCHNSECINISHMGNELHVVNMMRRSGCGSRLRRVWARRKVDGGYDAHIVRPWGACSCVCRRFCDDIPHQLEMLELEQRTGENQRCTNPLHARLHPCFVQYDPEQEDFRSSCLETLSKKI